MSVYISVGDSFIPRIKRSLCSHLENWSAVYSTHAFNSCVIVFSKIYAKARLMRKLRMSKLASISAAMLRLPAFLITDIPNTIQAIRGGPAVMILDCTFRSDSSIVSLAIDRALLTQIASPAKSRSLEESSKLYFATSDWNVDAGAIKAARWRAMSA